jgi:hypothetical protein
MKTNIMLCLAVSAAVLLSCNKYRTPTYEVGQEAFGGVVIKLDASGEHGVVVAKQDQVTTSPSMNYYESLDVIAGFNEGGAGWRMPSKDELLTMYSMKHSIGNFRNSTYWSSTKSGSLNYAVFFGNGFTMTVCNNVSGNCSRAVKDF